MGICSEAFYKNWILFPNVWNLSRLSQRRTQGKAKCGKNAIKRSFTSRLATNISLYLRNGWLNPLSIHVTFSAIVPGAYPGEAKMYKKCAKMANFWTYGLNYWAHFVRRFWAPVERRNSKSVMMMMMMKRLKIDGYMLRCVWQALNPLSIHVTYTSIFPGAYPGRPKCV